MLVSFCALYTDSRDRGGPLTEPTDIPALPCAVSHYPIVYHATKGKDLSMTFWILSNDCQIIIALGEYYFFPQIVTLA